MLFCFVVFSVKCLFLFLLSSHSFKYTFFLLIEVISCGFSAIARESPSASSYADLLAHSNPDTRTNHVITFIRWFVRYPLNADEVGRRVKKSKATLTEYLPVWLCCTEPAAAPRSEQSDPEAVVRLEAGRKNINLLYYSCTRKTISATRTQGIYACLFVPWLRCIYLISSSVVKACIMHKMQ